MFTKTIMSILLNIGKFLEKYILMGMIKIIIHTTGQKFTNMMQLHYITKICPAAVKIIKLHMNLCHSIRY